MGSNVVLIRSFGVDVCLIFQDATLSPILRGILPPDACDLRHGAAQRVYHINVSAQDRYTVRITDCEVNYFGDRESMLDFLEGDIQLFVAEFATPHLFMHAGVVAWNGTAILLPGRSFAGKSTLVTSLVQAGATYYSDEYAVLDADGRVLPYPRRVSLRSGPHGPGGRLDLSAHAPSGEAACTPIPVGLVALLRYEPDAMWDVQALEFLPAIMAMSEQMVAIQRRSTDTMTTLRNIARSAQVIQGTRGEVGDTIERILGPNAVVRT